MEPINPVNTSSQYPEWHSPWQGSWVVVLLALLPYASYLSLIGLGVLLVITVYRYFDKVVQVLFRSGWWVIAVALLPVVAFAAYPGESALQLANFLPFMVFLGAIAAVLPQLPAPFKILERWGSALLVASIPITLRSLVEYILKAPAIEAQLSGLWALDWLYGQVNYGHRADSVFGHPNVLAGYLVMLLGLGLGMSLRGRCCRDLQPSQYGWWERPGWIIGATALLPVGIFCSGSRNGVLVAIVLVGLCAWIMRRSRVVVIGGLTAVTALTVGVTTWGIGGRNLAEAFSTTNLRVQVWSLAVDMIRQHPWLGSGLGSYRLSYIPYSVQPYDKVEHAHNLWLLLAAELGIPLTVGITGLVGWCCWRGSRRLVLGAFTRQQRYLLASYLLGFIGCSLFALFDVTFYDARVNLLGWLMLAVIQAIPSLESRSASPNP
ncbi:hypothetical protein C7271_02700 [filamentous cyanobacterium CCP5]|nr:hypothetical protein C7271_02700 [filamentous cyanobacterium CCP5]